MTRRARAQARVLATRDAAERLKGRAVHERREHRSIDAGFEMAERDLDVGGRIMAGALAYRLFIWLLPLALVAIAGLGIAADAASTNPQDAAQSVGLTGIVSSSVASSAKSSSRVYALLVGIPILLYATRSVLQTLIISFRLVWTDTRAAVPKPTVSATLQLVLVMALFLLISAGAAAVRHASPLLGVFGILILVVPYSALWLYVCIRLPHRDAPWPWLVPGALAFGLGLEAVHALTTWFIGPNVSSKEGTYGSLGVAAALLLGLFFLSRVVVASAVINATLWDRHTRADSPPGQDGEQASTAASTVG